MNQHWGYSAGVWWKQCRSGGADAGVTLLEMMTVVLIVGILAAIASPGWLSFRENRTLDAAQDQVFQQIRLAQSQAERSRTIWQFSLRERNGTVQVATHPASTRVTPETWQSLPPLVRLLDLPGVADTTLQHDRTEGIYQVQFTHQGRVNGSLGKVTLTTGSGNTRRCVIVSTLLGALRKAANQACD